MSKENVINIVVLVSGTVDPVNMDPVLRSVSYPSPDFKELDDPTAKKTAQQQTPGVKPPKDLNWYWEENETFRDALRMLRKQYTNLHVFEAHGWTGDNSVQARTISGAYLANRLCGAMNEPAYYSKHLDKKVHFHFIGHSHGGNVINELTRQAAKVWPKQWKIRTITYLSTPFFTQLHQVDTGAFDDDCKIINAFCKYDITQRVIADFSMHPMTGLLKAAGSEEIGCLAACLMKQAGAVPQLFKALKSSVDVSFLKEGADKNSKTWKTLQESLKDGVSWKDVEDVRKAIVEDLKKVDIRGVHYGTAEAKRFYSHVLLLLEQLHQIFMKVRAAITLLRDGFTYEVHRSIHPSKKMTRKVLSPATAAKFIRELDLLEGGLDKTKAAFKNRLNKGRFPIQGLVLDIHVTEFLKPLITFLTVNPKTLEGPLWELLASVLAEQVDVFDNTIATPEKQLAGKVNSKGKAFTLVHVDVTPADHYTQVKGSAAYDAAFNSFVKRLEAIEAQLAGRSLRTARRPLLELLFTLVANLEPVRDLFSPVDADYVRWARTAMTGVIEWKKFWKESSEFELEVLRALSVVMDYVTIIKERSFGRMEVAEADIPLTLRPYYVAKPTTKAVSTPNKPAVEGTSAQVDCGCGNHTPKAAARHAAGDENLLKPMPGSIPYLATVAHSTSRQTLHDGVKTVLKQQLTTLSKTGR